MIITPKELNERKSELTVIDVRPMLQRTEFPVEGLDTIISENGTEISGEKVLVCQFGIVTEGMIIENELDGTFSLLGGAQAWDEFYRGQKDLSRWSRQTVLPEIGIEGQNSIINGKIAIVGMGGLGCPAAQSLVSAGVGYLHLIDGDSISLSNLHRQHLYTSKNVGKKKVNVAKEKLENLNPDTTIHITDKYLNEKNAEKLLLDVNVILDGTDNFEAKRLIDKISKKKKIPMIYGGLFRFEGQVSICNANESLGLGELFPQNPVVEEACEDAGTLGMLSSIIGNIQALEALKLIIGIKPNLAGKLLIYNGKKHTTEIIEL